MVHVAVPLVGPGGVGEEALDGGLDLTGGFLGGRAGQGAQPVGELALAGGQVLADVVEDLGAVVRRGLRPAGGLVRGLDGVADVLPVAPADLAYEGAVGRENREGVAGVGARLFAADVELGGAVDGGGAVALGGGARGGRGSAGATIFTGGRSR